MVEPMKQAMDAAARPEPPAGTGFWVAGRFSPRQVDWMVVGAAAVLALPTLVHTAFSGTRSVAAGLVTLSVGTVPLLWRRRHPGSVLATLAAGFAVAAIFAGGIASPGGLLFGVGSEALYGGRRVRLVAGIAALGALVVAFASVVVFGEAQPLGHLAATAIGAGVAWVVGDRTRTRRAYLTQLEERTARLERERAEHSRRAAEAERNRLARELHDVVAHNVSVIAVQAGAARMASDPDPELAIQTLGLIERTARSTLAELRALLGILRRQDDERPNPSRRPQPTLAQLDALVARACQAGLRLQTRVQGDLEGLPATVDLSAYRIVQEALTNALKHAPGAHVHLLVRRTRQAVDVVVVDDGPGASATPGASAAGGQGLIGMGERAALVGGRLSAGPALGGGFRVHAHLPVAVKAELEAPGVAEAGGAAGTVPHAADRPAGARARMP
jgi:signal transduction histidine kinase